MPVVSSVADLKKLTQELEAYYGIYHEEAEIDQRWYNLDKSLNLDMPKKFASQGVLLPTAKSVVDTASDHVSPQFRLVTVPRKSSSTTATENARQQQRFFSSFLTYLERDHKSSPYRLASKQLGIYGLSVWKLHYLPQFDLGRPKQKSGEAEEAFEERLEEYRINKASKMPFALRVINPLNIYVDPWNPTPNWAIEKSTKLVGELREIFPKWEGHNGRRNTDTVEVYEYWDKKNRFIVANDRSVFGDSSPSPHGLGDHPYIVGDSGLGFEDEESTPENKYVGYLRHIRDVLKSESRNYSIVDIVLKASAWPIRVAKGEAAASLAGVSFEYGELINLPEGAEIENLTPDLPPNMVFSQLAQTSAIVGEAVAPRVIRGLREPGTTSGFDQQIQLGEARLRYQGLAFALKNMLTQLCVKAATYMEKKVKNPINIGIGTTEDEYKEINPKLFKGVRTVSIEVNVLRPDDEFRKKQALAAELQSGLIDPENAIKDAHPELDPQEVMARVREARIENNPIVQNLLATILATKIQSDEDLSELLQRAVERIAQQSAESAGPVSNRVPANPEDQQFVTGDTRDSGLQQAANNPGFDQ